MNNGWDESADAWIASMGDDGDWSRRHVLDPVMIDRVRRGRFETALDVGCGEGRFCRMLKRHGVDTIGIDPTEKLIAEARQRDPGGDYRLSRAEALDFEDSRFDLVVSYLTLVDIDDYRAAIREMARVLQPSGSLLMANMTSVFTARTEGGWAETADGERLHFRIDRYLEESADWFEWEDIRIRNWHRPLGAYMRAFLDCGLTLTFFDEPTPTEEGATERPHYSRVPWFLVMEWRQASPVDR